MTFYSPIEPIYYILPFIGLLVGLFGTMVGGGGGFVFLPVLILIVDVPAHTAVITSLVATLPVGIAGSLGHYRNGNVNLRLALMFALAGLFGAFAGVSLTNLMTEKGLRITFGAYCFLMGIYIFFNTRNFTMSAENLHKGVPSFNKKNIAKNSFFGFSAGTITGAFGTSGAAPLMAGLLSLSIPIKLVIGTSLLIVASNTIFAIGAHFLVGQIDLTLVMFLTAGSMIGAVIGPLLLSRIDTSHSEGRIRYIIAGVMAVLGILMIWG